MSPHFDSAAALADGRINPCDLYAFPAAPDTTALVVTVNPDAGRSSPTAFRPDALYQFAAASNTGTSEGIALRVAFTEPDDNGQHRFGCSAPTSAPPPTAWRGQCWARAAPVRCSPSAATGWPGAGLAADPFSGDGVALGNFLY